MNFYKKRKKKNNDDDGGDDLKNHDEAISSIYSVSQENFILDEELEKEQLSARKHHQPDKSERDLFFTSSQDSDKKEDENPQNWIVRKIIKLRDRYNIELTILATLILPFMLISFLLVQFDIHPSLWGESIFAWSLSLLYCWCIFILSHLLVHFIWTILSRFMTENMDHLYYISGLSPPLVFLLWSSVINILWLKALPDLTSESRRIIGKSLLLILIISISYFISRILQKFISAHTNTQNWHLQMKTALLREQLIEKLIQPREFPPITDRFVNFLKTTVSTAQETIYPPSSEGLRSPVTSHMFVQPQGSSLSPKTGRVLSAPSPFDEKKQSNPVPSSLASIFSPISQTSSYDLDTINKDTISNVKEIDEEEEELEQIRSRERSFPEDLTSLLEEDSFLNPFWGSPAGVLMERAKWPKSVRTKKAKLYAKRIWANLCTGKNKEYLSSYDFWGFFHSKELTKLSMELFDLERSSRVTKDNLVIALEGMFEQRKFLVDTLRDRDNISRILRNLFNVVFWFLMSIIALFVFEMDVNTTFFSAITVLVGLSFAFGRVILHVIESIILIFVTSPFDVGDRLIIHSIEKNPLKVAKIRLMTTILFRKDGQQFVVPNYMFYEKSFSNLKRSKNIYYPFRFTVHHSTSAFQLKCLKEEIKEFLVRNPKHYGGKFEFVIDEIKDTNDLKLLIWVEFKIPWQEIERYFQLKTQFHLLVQRVCIRNEIVYFDSPQKIEVTGNHLQLLPPSHNF